jgi:ABC-2 type transport system ATP-binding protein
MCDRVAIINGGRVLACDTPAVLKRRLQREPIFHLETTPLDGTGADPFQALPGVSHVTHRAGDGRATLEFVLKKEDVLGGVMATMQSRGIGLLNLVKREPTLEDVFVDLVGKSMADVEQGDAPPAS